ncbi:MAG: Xaa-Pro peptidase family protein [Actinomycetota bacterium]|nr:Xaa-Pro peptidase family protein [Actinomycetota bacterium]
MYDLKNKNLLFDIKRLLEEMEIKKIDAVLASNENSAYLSGYFTNTWSWEIAYLQILNREHEGTNYTVFTVVPKDLVNKEPFIVESYHKREYVKSCDLWIKNIKCYSTNRKNVYNPPEKIRKNCLFQESIDIKNSPIEAVAEGLKEQGLEKGRIGIEGDKLPSRFLSEFKSLLPMVEFIDVSEIYNNMRAIKTEEEIKRMREVYRVAEKSYNILFPTIKPGMTPYEIFIKQMNIILENQCTMNFQHCNFSGANDFAVAAEADRKIKNNDYGVFDVGVWKNGYQTDFARVASIGEPEDKIKKIYDIVLGARRKIIKNLEPGLKGRELFFIGAKYLEDKGYCPAINCMGHGLGIGMHEFPFISANDETEIKIGNTIVIEIYVEAKGVGPFLLEDAGLVSEKGWESLTTLTDELIIL